MRTTVRRTRLAEATPPPKVVRVAIYTRQSVADDLEFNSLDAQRQAIESYIASQKSLGWEALPESYDDQGFSGGTIERPAFQRLLHDVQAGKVDVVAIHRLDRLSRSINDFVRILERFTEHGVSLVSTTQAFDTSTSLGRMTVNLLATFATYERDLIRERTHEKMAASRRRGMWTGGPVPLGYDLREKKLVVNEAEADQVREVFRIFLELKSVMATVQELNARGWTKKTSGKAFDKSAVHTILRNVIYLGKMGYRGEAFDASHSAILDQATWDEAQKLLAHPERRYRPPTNRTPALLRGLLRCGACGTVMVPHYAQKRGRRWAYYVCQTLQKQGAKACPGSRVAMAALEAAVMDRIRVVGQDPSLVAEVVQAARVAVEARRPALEAEVAGLDAERTRLAGERKHLLEAVSRNGSGSSGLLAKLGEVEGTLAKNARQLEDARAAAAALQGQVIDEANLRAALESFTPVWDELFPPEKARILQLLLEVVRFDARAGEVEVTFRTDGVKEMAKGGEGSTAERK